MTCMERSHCDFVRQGFVGRTLRESSSPVAETLLFAARIPLYVYLYAQGSPMHDRLFLALPVMNNPFGVSTYVPGHGVHGGNGAGEVRVFGLHPMQGDRRSPRSGSVSRSVLDRAGRYEDVGRARHIAGTSIVAGGDPGLRAQTGLGRLK